MQTDRTLAKRGRAGLVCLCLLLWGGCSSVPEDAGFSEVSDTVSQRTGYEIRWTRDAQADARVDQALVDLMSQELTLERAVRVALLNNRRLQATYEQLGIARGALIQAGLLENPIFGGEWWDFDAGTSFEGLITQNILSAITIPMRKQLRGSQYEATKLQVTTQVIHLIGDVKRAYWAYQANKQMVEMLRSVVQATQSSYETMALLREAGNTPQFDVFRERTFYEEAKVQLNAAVERLAMSREQMNVLMGLYGPRTKWQTPPRLPEVPGKAENLQAYKYSGEAAVLPGQFPANMEMPSLKAGETEAEARAEALAGGPTNDQLAAPAGQVLGSQSTDGKSDVDTGPEEPGERFAWIEKTILEHNLELAALKDLIEAQAGRLKLDTTLAIFPFINTNFTSEYTTEDEWGIGPSIDIPIPVWDHGQGQMPQEQARLRRRIEEYVAAAVDIRAAARAAQARLTAARSRALYMRDVVLPLHASLVAEAQLQYNAMQVTPFELLRAKLRQIAAGQQYIASLLHYWTARTDLEQLLDGSLPPGVIGHTIIPGSMLVQQIAIP